MDVRTQDGTVPWVTRRGRLQRQRLFSCCVEDVAPVGFMSDGNGGPDVFLDPFKPPLIALLPAVVSLLVLVLSSRTSVNPVTMWVETASLTYLGVLGFRSRSLARQ